VVTFTIDPSLRNYTPEQAQAVSKALLEKTSALPGVRAAALAGRPLMRGTGVKSTFGAAGTHIRPTDFLNSSLNEVTPGYFAAMGMHVLAGRDFTWFDHYQALPHPVVVNGAFARQFFPGRDPVGERFGFAGPGGIALAENQIVGVVNDAKYRSLREPIPPTVYNPFVDGFFSGFVLTIRTRQRPEAMFAPVRELLHSLDPQLPIIETHTLHQEVEASLWQERLLAWLSTVFGAVAALLAAIGLYGTLDYAVKSRTREIGVRMALGARPEQIAALLSRATALLVGSGIALGLVCYAAAAGWISRVLYGVPSWDPVAIALVLLLLCAAAVLAAAPAAYRASHTDPASALRSE
jgi:predicted permease